MTARFANVPFANVLCHDTKKCDTHVYTSFFQQLIRQKRLGNWPNTYVKRLQNLASRRLAKRLVGETTVNPTEHTEGACIWLTSALIGKLSELRDNLKLMCVIQCFFFPRLDDSFYTITCPRSPITSSLSHCKLVIVHNRLQRVKRIYEIILQLLKKETHLVTNIVVTLFKER